MIIGDAILDLGLYESEGIDLTLKIERPPPFFLSLLALSLKKWAAHGSLEWRRDIKQKSISEELSVLNYLYFS
jgi:hypothetical protein